MKKKLAFAGIGLLIYFVGMFVGETLSPDATAIRQNGNLQTQLDQCSADVQRACSDIDAQDKALVQLGAPASQVTLHCSPHQFLQ